jgi:hypothetical protein
MRKFWLAGAVLAISACSSGGGNNANNTADTGDMNMAAPDNGTGNQNAMLDSVNAAAANGSIDANTQSLMQKDAKTHDHDTNLANGI